MGLFESTEAKVRRNEQKIGNSMTDVEVSIIQAEKRRDHLSLRVESAAKLGDQVALSRLASQLRDVENELTELNKMQRQMNQMKMKLKQVRNSKMLQETLNDSSTLMSSVSSELDPKTAQKNAKNLVKHSRKVERGRDTITNAFDMLEDDDHLDSDDEQDIIDNALKNARKIHPPLPRIRESESTQKLPIS